MRGRLALHPAMRSFPDIGGLIGANPTHDIPRNRQNSAGSRVLAGIAIPKELTNSP
jgi:hypothetical protein